jgi:rubrerythrin
MITKKKNCGGKMKEMTKRALGDAFAGESMAHMKYIIYSDIARKEGYSNVARLFEAIAYAERVHAGNHAKLLGLLGKTINNLQTGEEGEIFEIEEMYPVYKNTANLQKEKAAELSNYYALEAEKIHKTMYEKSKKEVIKDKDIELEEVYVCPVCGYTHQGVLPDKCPVCGASSKIFKKF